MSIVKILSGVSGSGKSCKAGELMLAYIATLDEQMALPAWDRGATAVLASADTYFTGPSGRYDFDASKLSEAHGECFKTYIEALQNKIAFIVVDNTNTTVEEISPYILGAQAYGCAGEVITVLCDPVIAAERNRHGVPYPTILAQAKRIKTRRLPPWWKGYTVTAFGT